MTVKLSKFDATEYLETDEDVAGFLSEALKTGDSEYVNHAFGVVARARGMTDIARRSGIKREALYRALSKTGNPQFKTIHEVIKAMGLTLTVSAS